MKIEFKKIKEEDILDLDKIVKEVVETEFPKYSSKVKNYILKTELNLYERIHIPVFNIWGIYVDKKTGGFLIGFGPVGGITEIQWIGLAKDYQNQGLGKKAVKFFINWAKNARAHGIHLYCSKKNLGFYEKLGFEKVGLVKKNFWGEDDYFLNMIIQEPKEENFLR